MDRINWLALVFAFLIACAMVTFLIVRGHADSLTVAVTAVCALVLTIVNVLRGKASPPSLPPNGGQS